MIYYFYGDNSYEIAQAIAALKRSYAKKTGSGLDVTTLDLEEVGLGECLDALSTTAMFANVRMVVAQNLSTNKTAQSSIAEIIELVSDATIAVITDSEVDRRSSYFKTLSKLSTAKEFVPKDHANLRNWVKARAKALGGEIDNLTAQKLVERVAHEYKPRDREAMKKCGQDQWQLEQELNKLIAYDVKITTDTIEELVVPNIEQSIFALTDSVARGRTADALAVYGRLVGAGVSDQQILAMLNWQYRNIVLAKASLGSDESWTSQFGISPFVLGKALQLGDGMDMDSLLASYRQMCEADLSIKSGEKDSHQALEELIYSLSTD